MDVTRVLGDTCLESRELSVATADGEEASLASVEKVEQCSGMVLNILLQASPLQQLPSQHAESAEVRNLQ